MKTRLKIFRIFTSTSLGMGFFEIKANSFLDAFERLSKKQKQKALTVSEKETGEEISVKELLGLELY